MLNLLCVFGVESLGAFHYARKGKWKDIFRSDRANQDEWLLLFFFPFLNSLHKWREVEQWTGWSKWNGKFRSEPKRTFPFDFGPKFPESLAQWKAPFKCPNFCLEVSRCLWQRIASCVHTCTEFGTNQNIRTLSWTVKEKFCCADLRL